MTRNLALYVALRLASWLVPFAPLRLAYRLAAFVGTCAYLVFAGPRQGITANLGRVLRLPPDHAEVRRRARLVFQNDARNWIDTLRIRRLSDSEILAVVEVEGWQHLEEAVRQGNGVVLVGLHLGNVDLVGQVLVARGFRLTIPVEHMRPERLFQFLLRRRTSKGVHAVAIDRAPREMLRALRAGEIVGIAGDRNVAGRQVRVDFFGMPTELPRGPVSLARHAGATIMLGVGVRQPDDSFHGFLTSPLPTVQSGDAERDDRENARRLAREMERFILSFPEQWIMFSPLWPEGEDGNPAATIGQQEEAAV